MIIVTGGAGFIGSNIIKGLNDRGINDIIVVDDLTDSRKHLNLNTLQFQDYIDKSWFIKNLEHFKNANTIFHQGACASTTETDGKYMMENNYQYSRDILHFCYKHSVDMIYASSAAVYGEGKEGFIEHPQCEYPLNVYGFSKLMFDNYVRNFNKAKEVMRSQIVGLRYFNVYGYQENHKDDMASVAFHMFNQFKNKQPLSLFKGSEKFLRDFVFIEDIIKVNLFFYENKISGIFNCGTGKARSFTDMATSLQKIEPEAKIKYIPFPDHLVGRYQEFTQANLSNLRSTGYKPEFTELEDGIKKYYKIFQESNGIIKNQL